jgi:hypothetical protein
MNLVKERQLPETSGSEIDNGNRQRRYPCRQWCRPGTCVPIHRPHRPRSLKASCTKAAKWRSAEEARALRLGISFIFPFAYPRAASGWDYPQRRAPRFPEHALQPRAG